MQMQRNTIKKRDRGRWREKYQREDRREKQKKGKQNREREN